jgi:hypothetical protein
MVSSDQGVIAIGGELHGEEGQSPALYQLTCNEIECHWYQMEQQLKIARQEFVAMLIPDSLTNCTKSMIK